MYRVDGPVDLSFYNFFYLSFFLVDNYFFADFYNLIIYDYYFFIIFSDHCLRAPPLDPDETIGLVYQILEHCALSLWGWAMCACEQMIGAPGGGDDDNADDGASSFLLNFF